MDGVEEFCEVRARNANGSLTVFPVPKDSRSAAAVKETRPVVDALSLSLLGQRDGR